MHEQTGEDASEAGWWAGMQGWGALELSCSEASVGDDGVTDAYHDGGADGAIMILLHEDDYDDIFADHNGAYALWYHDDNGNDDVTDIATAAVDDMIMLNYFW